MKKWLQKLMYGRYGNDNLSKFLSVMSLIAMSISMLTKWSILYSFALVLLFVSIFRILSYNTYKRARENNLYLRLRKKITGWFSVRKRMFKERKTHRYYNCPSCRAQLRVPKGRGYIKITCPKCRAVFEKKN